MREISHKISTLRIATAVALVKMDPQTLELVKNNQGPKPDILPIARAAAFLAVKNTANVIPHCHPIPVEHTRVDYGFEGDELRIAVTVKSIYRTGCEMEALHGASIAALTVYDMLKPLDQEIEISRTYLESKTGGKSTFRSHSFERPLSAAVIVCSDTVSQGKKEDKAGKVIIEKLQNMGVDIVGYDIIPDDPDTIKSLANVYLVRDTDLVITTGGTGLSPRDLTVEAIRDLIDREVPGIMEAARSYGQERTPYAMLSRGIAGIKGKSLILTLPGSTKGAEETMDALFPHSLHILKVLDKAYKHEDMRGGNHS